MGAKPAVGIIHRRELAAAPDPEAARERLAATYARRAASPAGRRERGLRRRADRPGETRARVAWALRSLQGAAMSVGGAARCCSRARPGFVGMELLARYLERSDRRDRHAGPRRQRRGGARADRRVLANLFGARGRQYAGRVDAVAARPARAAARARPGSLASELARRVSTIVHCAASVSFSLPLDEARAINLEGTRRMLEFAELACERGGPRALRPRLDRVRRRHPLRPLRRVRPRRRAAVPQLLRAVEVRGRAARARARRGCRSRSCARASSSATAAAAGRRRSTCSTGRCGRLPGGCSRPCRRSRRRRSTSSRSTTSPTRSTRCARTAASVGETYNLTAGAAREHDRRDRQPRQPLLPDARAEGALAGRVRALDGDASPLQRSGLEGGRAYFPYFSIGTVFDDGDRAGPARSDRDPGLAAGRLPGAAARLRDPQPLGQAADRARRSARLPDRPVREKFAPQPGGSVAARRCRLRDETCMLAAVDQLFDVARFREDDPGRARDRVAGVPAVPVQRTDRVGAASAVGTIHRSNAHAHAASNAGGCS